MVVDLLFDQAKRKQRYQFIYERSKPQSIAAIHTTLIRNTVYESMVVALDFVICVPCRKRQQQSQKKRTYLKN